MAWVHAVFRVQVFAMLMAWAARVLTDLAPGDIWVVTASVLLLSTAVLFLEEPFRRRRQPRCGVCLKAATFRLYRGERDALGKKIERFVCDDCLPMIGEHTDEASHTEVRH